MPINASRGHLAAAAVTLTLTACTASLPEPAAVRAAPPAQAQAAPPAGDAPAATAPPAATAAPAAPSRRASLRFDVDGDDFPSPLIDVVVGGQPTTMIVDTGATHQVVASWVAAQIGPSTATGTTGMDHAGKQVALSRLDGATLIVSGWGAVDSSQMFVIPVPESLQKRGIGGVLSPQALAAEGRAVLLDFRKNTMKEALLADAMRVLEGEPGEALSGEIRSCGKGGGALPFVRATIAGVEVDAQIDTGATHSTVRAASEVGARLRPLAKGTNRAYAASGAFTIPTVDAAHVKVGGLEADTPVDIVTRDSHPLCGNDALLGMELLRRCVLVLGDKTLAAKCSAPAR